MFLFKCLFCLRILRIQRIGSTDCLSLSILFVFSKDFRIQRIGSPIVFPFLLEILLILLILRKQLELSIVIVENRMYVTPNVVCIEVNNVSHLAIHKSKVCVQLFLK